MKFNDKRLCRNTTLLLLLSYFLSFLVYYLPSFVIASDALSYFSMFFRKCVYLLIPICAAYVTFIVSSVLGIKWAVIRLIPMTAVRIVYLLPLFYLMLLGEGFDSLESLGIGLALALGEAAIAYALTLLVFFFMRTVQGYKREGERGDDLLPSDAFDFSNRTSLAAFIVSGAAFLYFFIAEIVDTVVYITEYSGNYRSGEIIYMVISFIYDILLLFVYYFAFVLIKRILMKRAEE